MVLVGIWHRIGWSGRSCWCRDVAFARSLMCVWRIGCIVQGLEMLILDWLRGLVFGYMTGFGC